MAEYLFVSFLLVPLLAVYLGQANEPFTLQTVVLALVTVLTWPVLVVQFLWMLNKELRKPL